MRYLSHACSGVFRTLIYLLFDRYFVFYCLSWCTIRVLRKHDVIIPYINSWLTDFVFVPLVAHFAHVVGLVLLRLTVPYKFPLYQLLALSALTSVVFEYIAPMYTPYNRADWGDVIAYFLGGVFYCCVHQKLLLKNMIVWKCKFQLF